MLGSGGQQFGGGERNKEKSKRKASKISSEKEELFDEGEGLRDIAHPEGNAEKTPEQW